MCPCLRDQRPSKQRRIRRKCWPGRRRGRRWNHWQRGNSWPNRHRNGGGAASEGDNPTVESGWRPQRNGWRRYGSQAGTGTGGAAMGGQARSGTGGGGIGWRSDGCAKLAAERVAGRQRNGGGASGGQAGTGTGGASAAGGAGSGGQGGGSAAPSTLVNTYDGARTTTVSFDSAWKFHLGDVSGAQATTFDDSSWTSLDVPHDWSISLAFNQSSASGCGRWVSRWRHGLVPKDLHVACRELGTEGLRPVRRRLHGQHRVPQWHPNRRPSLRLFLLRMRLEVRRQVWRVERARSQGQQPTAEQPLVLGKRHLSSHLAQDGEPGSRRLHRHAGDDANGLDHRAPPSIFPLRSKTTRQPTNR